MPRGGGESDHLKVLKQNAVVKTWLVLPTMCWNYRGARYIHHRGSTTDHIELYRTKFEMESNST
jgi:hypothetical protein